MLTLVLISYLLTSTFATSALAPRDAAGACNGSPDLCSRSYSNITHLGAHDSPFVSNGSSNPNSITSLADAGNQNINSTAQLTAGVRLLSAQVHNKSGAWHLCHTSCALLDAGTLSAWLAEIKSWMDANPHDVVTLLLVNADNASAADLDKEFKVADISSYGYIPPSTSNALSSWPTLQDMISHGTRLVTFVASLPPSSNSVAPYLLDEFTFVFENNYNVTLISNFSCTADRPPTAQGKTSSAISSGMLSLVNHFLDRNIGFGIQVPDRGNITITNGVTGTGSLGEAASFCTTLYGKKPVFFLVDYVDQGSTLQIVNNLNSIMADGSGSTPSATATTQPTSSTPAAQPSNSLGAITRRPGLLLLTAIIFWVPVFAF